MKLLFIAYHFDPYPGVGSTRISYWAKHAKRLDPNIQKVDVITTTSNPDKTDGIDHIYVIPISSEQKKFLDIGSDWIKPLKDFLNDHLKLISYDVAIITGNPFGHFFIQDKLKKSNIKTIIDFRDPMALNPRAIKSVGFYMKLPFKVFLEAYFIYQSTLTICINKYCKNLILFKNIFNKKIKLIDNGYDESVFQCLKSKTKAGNKVSLAFAGTAYDDRSPNNLIEAINESSLFELWVIGNNNHIPSSSNVLNKGFQTYKETIEILKEADILVLLTAGYPFESSTKIFDYLRLKKPILILSQNEYKRTAIKDILENYPAKIFVKNEKLEIKKALHDITGIKDPINYSHYKFSREVGLKNLLNYLRII